MINDRNSRKINIPAGIYLLKINNRNTRRRYEICSILLAIPEMMISSGIKVG